MLCPKLATQGQFIGKSAEGRAFAFRDFGEYKGIGANAQPLQICFYFVSILFSDRELLL